MWKLAVTEVKFKCLLAVIVLIVKGRSRVKLLVSDERIMKYYKN